MNFLKKYWYMPFVLILTTGLGVMVFLTSQKLTTAKPVAPTVPQEVPEAAVPACTLTFTLAVPTPTPTPTPGPTATPTPTPTPSPTATPTPTPTPIHQTSIGFTSFDGGGTTFDCIPGPNATITSNSASLLDTNAVSVVSGSCYFTCYQENPLDLPKIGIHFSLVSPQPTGGAAVFNEFRATAIPFETTIVLRNRAIR